MKQGDHVFLVDGSAYIFRAYHALPPLTRKSDGLPCGAVAGFCNMLWKLVCEARDEKNAKLAVPTHFAVVFDYSSQTFRKEIYPEYKANRSAPPEDLIPQFALIRAATRAFNLPCLETQGYEADDIIATLARAAEKQGAQTTIISGDKDLMQLVSPQIRLYDSMKDKETGIAEVEEKWGVPPEKMVDFQALVGDATDNVPGVAGIGPKTAAELLGRFGSLDNVLARAGEISQKKRRETLIEQADQARLSRRLVELDTQAPVGAKLDDLTLLPPEGVKLVRFLKAMEFNSLTRRVAQALDIDAAAVEPEYLEVEWDGKKSAAAAGAHGPDMPELDISVKAEQKTASAAEQDSAYDNPQAAPQHLAAKLAAAAKIAVIDRSGYQMLSDKAALAEWLAEAREQGFFAFDTETDSLNARAAELVGFSIALSAGKAAYVPLAHVEGPGDLLGAPLAKGQMEKRAALALLKPLLEDESVLKIGQNIKYDLQVMARQGVNLRCFDDTMLMSYVLQAGAAPSHGLDALAEFWLNHKNISYAEICGSGKNAISFAEADLAKATEYAAEDADITLRLWQVLRPQLTAAGLKTIYEREERALLPVLALMEERGILVDKAVLNGLSARFSKEADERATEIYALAGEEFNIGSPKQLGELLFGKFALPSSGKTKTGQWSTSAQALEDLAARAEIGEIEADKTQGYKLAGKIVAWRQLKKLQSTYTDALPNFQDAAGRVHTHYAQAATTTGRLASAEPNLQNIPIRTVEGRLIRTAFIAPPGKLLLSADYSQIELRILAAQADIAALKQAFADGIDIHALTASEMFAVPLKEMTAEIRRRAKAINFGIIYGISAFGLANQLSIGREEARQYIKTYFERFPGIEAYMEATKAQARAKGYVETMFGRRIHYPQIAAANAAVRAFNERAAINAPIQGTAADIIRRAMVQIECGGVKPSLAERGLSAQMLLQVHDELIFEVAEAEASATAQAVREIMEDAAFPALNLSVPLRVEARLAKNWDEAH